MEKLLKCHNILLILLVAIVGCKKESITSVQNTNSNNPPIVHAGVDQVIELPKDSTVLSGTGQDTDGTIISYHWNKISGPACSIIDSNKVFTSVKNLEAGTYVFELRVTDNGGLVAKDQIGILVLPARLCSSLTDSIYVRNGNVRMIPFGNLSVPRYMLASATAGNKLIFAGGYECHGGRWHASATVDIFDLANQTWTTARLPTSRGDVKAVASGAKILISDGSFVDIYDATSNTWSSAMLSVARTEIAAIAIGNKVYFAGGTTGYSYAKSKRVDIYDVTANVWHTEELSEGRLAIGAAANANELFFAGGFTDEAYWDFVGTTRTVDIYNTTTLLWSTALLSEGRGGIASIGLNNKIFFAGGYNDKGPSAKVDIYDRSLQSWSTATLSKARNGIEVVSSGDKILFGTGGSSDSNIPFLDIYDASAGTWSIAELNKPLNQWTVARAGAEVYMAGGAVGEKATGQVWKLVF